MPLTELYRESFLALSVDSESAVLYADWKGYQSVDSIKQGCEAILQFMVRNRAFRVINDNTHVVGIWRFAAEWVANNWFPRMKQAGLAQFAWIYSPTKLSQVSTDTTLSLMDPDAYHVRIFHDVDQARSWLELPERGRDASADAGREVDEATGRDASKGTRALIIEDNADFSRLFRDMLEIMGCSVEVASNAETGLKIATSEELDVVFCDIGLPGKMDGYEFARQVRNDERLEHVALIAVSGRTGEQDRDRAVAAGFDRVFPKPVKFVDVSKALATFGKGPR